MTTKKLRRIVDQATNARRQLKSERTKFVKRTYKDVLADRSGAKLEAIVSEMIGLGFYSNGCNRRDVRIAYLHLAWRIDTAFTGYRWEGNWRADPNYWVNWIAIRGFTTAGESLEGVVP